MGTQFNGKKPENHVTVSRSATVRNVDPVTGEGVESGREQAAPANVPERSFAQPSPAAVVKPVTPKAHASEQDEADAIKRNSVKPAPIQEVVDDAEGDNHV